MNAQALPFVAPFLLFMLFLIAADGSFPDQHYLLYPVKSLLVAGVIIWYWRALPSLKPAQLLLSMLIGVLGVVLWVGLYPLAMLINAWLEPIYNAVVGAVGLTSWQMPVGEPVVGRDPFALYPAGEAWTLFVLRVLGISLVVPIMEELFWRGFLMRWLIREELTEVKLGTYQPFSFWITTLCFTAVHGDLWLLAVIVGVIYGGWFIYTKSLGSVMVAHGVTNFLLALYALHFNAWHFLSTISPVHK